MSGGSVRVGRAEKKFDDPARPDFWARTGRWRYAAPPTYSYFDLSAERYTEEPIVLLEDVTDTGVYSLGGSHKCTEQRKGMRKRNWRQPEQHWRSRLAHLRQDQRQLPADPDYRTD